MTNAPRPPGDPPDSPTEPTETDESTDRNGDEDPIDRNDDELAVDDSREIGTPHPEEEATDADVRRAVEAVEF